MTLPAPAPIYYSKRLRLYLSDLWSRREFVWFLAIGNFKARNASTALGLFWWVLNPLLLSLVYYLVFGVLFDVGRDIIYLMAGMFVFHFTSQSLTGGANAVLQNSKLLANLRFPRIILPIANLIESTLGFLVSLGVLLVIAMLAGLPGLSDLEWSSGLPGAGFLLLLIIIPLQLMFNLGLAAIAARLAVPFRDINNFIPYLNRIWLYLSPIIWPLSFLDDRPVMARLAEWNPMFAMISVYRTALIDYEFQPRMLLYSAVWAVVVFLVGVGLFVRYEGNIVRHL
jgi:teichoic acid transport system permease protein